MTVLQAAYDAFRRMLVAGGAPSADITAVRLFLDDVSAGGGGGSGSAVTSVNGHSGPGAVSVTKGDVGLGNVTNVNTSIASGVSDDSGAGFGPTVADTLLAYDSRLDANAASITANTSAIASAITFTTSFQFANSDPTTAAASPRWPNDVYQDRSTTPYTIWDAGDPNAANPLGNGWIQRQAIVPGADNAVLGWEGGQITTLTALQLKTGASLLPGTDIQAFDADLSQLAALDATPGFLAKTGNNAYARRTLTAGSSRISITHTDGTTADPVFDVVQANLALGSIGGSLGVSQINATGTPSVSTILYGNGTWGSASAASFSGLGSVSRNKTIGGVSDFGRASAAVLSNSNRTLAADTEYHTDYLWMGKDGAVLDLISLFVVTAVSGGIKVMVFNIDSAGWAGTTWLAQQTLTVGGNNAHISQAISSGPTLNYGFYYRIVTIADNTSVLRGFNSVLFDAPLGTTNGLPTTVLTRTGSYTTGIAAPPSNSSGTPNAQTATAAPLVQLRGV